jgi:formiminotetrahydrofolate cyclodeaminase
MRDDTIAAFLEQLAADAVAFGSVAQAYQLPRATEAEHRVRSASIASALARAAG